MCSALQPPAATLPAVGLVPSFQSTVQVCVSRVPGSVNLAVTDVPLPTATGDFGPVAEVIFGAALVTVTVAESVLRPPVRVTS